MSDKLVSTDIPTNFEIINEVIGEDCREVQLAKYQGRRLRIHRNPTQNSIWYNGLPRWKAHGVKEEEIPGRRGYRAVISTALMLLFLCTIRKHTKV